jgi:hypothetical protein
MTNATDAVVSSFFSDEAEAIKRRSFTSLWIGLGVCIPAVFIIVPGFLLLFVAPLWGALILMSCILAFIVGVVFILRFAFLRLKLSRCVGSQVRESLKCKI